MGHRHNTGQNKTIADVASGTTHAHTLVALASVCAATSSDVDALIGNGGVGVMKVSRSIRKEWDRAILIAFATVMLAVCISPALASETHVPPDPANLANSTGRYWVNYTWQVGSGWHLVAGDAGGGFHGYNRTGSSWRSDGVVVSGLSGVGNYSAPTVFRKGDEWYLIAGTEDGGFNGYNRTGSSWRSDGVIVSGLPDADLPDAEDHFKPTVFRKDGDWYLIAGAEDGGFHGYNWTGSSWQSDGVIVSGLSAGVGTYSAPTVFRKDRGWYLIAGAGGGRFYGYNWAGSSWQCDSVIASGLPDVRDRSTPAVFDMGCNVTDSYNISINGSWHNGTTNTSAYTAVSPSRWVNITVWAWNASGTGTLSTVCISDNVQAPKDPSSTFGLVGSVPTGGGGTYPPGWFETPTPAVTATKAPAASANATATAAPPGERVTPAPTKRPAAAKAAAPAAEGMMAEAAKKSAPGFTAVFVIAGLLAVAYAMMRRRV
jgi:PGF-CTERM protein